MQYLSACRYYRVTSTDGCQSPLGRSLALGSNEKNKLYLLTDVIRVLMETPVSQAAEHQDPNKMTPKERKNWFDSEKGRLWLEKEMKQVVPLSEVRQQMAAIVKAITQVLEVWPDKLERDKGWSADQLNEAQDVVDEVRILLVKAIQETADDDGE